MYNFSIKRATHQIFGTHAGSPRSSLRFSDSRCHSSTPFFSWCTQNTRCSGRCSSSGSPSPCSPPQPAEKVPHRRRLNIHKRRTRGAPSSIRALPWRKLGPAPLAPRAPAAVRSLHVAAHTRIIPRARWWISLRKIQIWGDRGIDSEACHRCVKVDPVRAAALPSPSAGHRPSKLLLVIRREVQFLPPVSLAWLRNLYLNKWMLQVSLFSAGPPLLRGDEWDSNH